MANTKNLVIVESPAKAKTINKFLGPDYIVEASMGHVKDLPKSKLGVDEEKDFEPTYKVLPSKKKVLTKLAGAAKKTSTIYLATDPDREGEAIGYHLAVELGDGREIYRVLLTEITKRGVTDAFEHPTEIDLDKVNAQQARRILDRLVGYKLSPLLWDKVRRGLSAGRVQSVALRMIVERQREIDAFESEEYWTIDAKLAGEEPPEFSARLVKIAGEESKVSNEKEADAVVDAVEKAEWKIASVTQKERRRNPQPPYITSKLQQDASRSLRFSVKKTMTLAQRLYEGKDLGPGGTVGLITYMRTDSTRISDQALGEVRDHILKNFGEEFLPKKGRTHKSRKGAQEAHEAIRPASLEYPPEKVKQFLEKDEWRLYSLIWNRFVASQMEAARFLDTRVEVEAANHTFRANGSIRKFAGFLAAFEGAEAKSDANPDNLLPALEEGQVLKLVELTPEQKFTQPPPHFNEASLVKALEENGIGRPSTYASIIAVIQSRDYVRKEKNKFIPSELGMLVSDLLTESFGDLIDVGYTARLEKSLDKIEEGKLDWVKALSDFNKKFNKDLDKARVEMKNIKQMEEETDETCEKCGSSMVIKWGRFGKFLACSGYPDCKNTRNLGEEGQPTAEDLDEECPKCGKPMAMRTGRFGPFLACTDYPECKTTKKVQVGPEGKVQKVEEKLLDEKCPKCGHQMVQKVGRYGPFVACSNYPDCKHIKREETGVACPRDGCEGQIVQKRGRRKAFYGCDKYPDCDFVLWSKPVKESCPECDAPFLLRKVTKKKGPHLICHTEECDYERILDDEDEDDAEEKAS